MKLFTLLVVLFIAGCNCKGNLHYSADNEGLSTHSNNACDISFMIGLTDENGNKKN